MSNYGLSELKLATTKRYDDRDIAKNPIGVFMDCSYVEIRKKCIKVITKIPEIHSQRFIEEIEFLLSEIVTNENLHKELFSETVDFIDWYIQKSNKSEQVRIRAFRFVCELLTKNRSFEDGDHFVTRPISRAIKDDPQLYWCDSGIDVRANQWIDKIIEETTLEINKSENSRYSGFLSSYMLINAETALRRALSASNTLLIPKIEKFYDVFSTLIENIEKEKYTSKEIGWYEKKGLIDGTLRILKKEEKKEKPISGLVSSFFKRELKLKGMVTLHAEYSFVPDGTYRNVIISFHLKASHPEEEKGIEEYLKNPERKEKQFYIIIDVFGSQDDNKKDEKPKIIRFSDLVANFSYIPFGPQQKCFIRIFDEGEEIAETCFYLEPDIATKEIV